MHQRQQGTAILSGAPHGAKSKDLLLRALALVLLCSLPASAQVLARPGWAGSGVTVETWWRRAVFYRLDPATFQDSNGDGRGDLAGVAQRMDYLQSLGVDALVLAPAASSPPLSPNDDAGFDDLTHAASTHHLRVLIALDNSSMTQGSSSLLAVARSWLTQGAAGFFLSEGLLANPQLTADLLHQLHALIATFPGERILVSAAGRTADPGLGPALHREVQLVAASPLTSTNVSALRSVVQSDLDTANAADARSRMGLPLLFAARRLPTSDAAQRKLVEPDFAVLLLASRTAVLLDCGQELGLDLTAANTGPLMQWTPGNRTLPPPPPPEIPKTFDTNAYKPFVPYVPPPPHSENPLPPPLPPAFVPETPDPRTLPGFSTAPIDASLAAPNGATANVVAEDADPRSMLNLYRHLIQLHHQNASLHDGAQVFLDHDAEDALVWLRRPTAGARTSTTVLAIGNLSSHNLHLHLDAELKQLHSPYGGLRTLVYSAPIPFEDSEDIVLPPGGAFLGEFPR
jgi:alpha-glucosidase